MEVFVKKWAKLHIEIRKIINLKKIIMIIFLVFMHVSAAALEWTNVDSLNPIEKITSLINWYTYFKGGADQSHCWNQCRKRSDQYRNNPDFMPIEIWVLYKIQSFFVGSDSFRQWFQKWVWSGLPLISFLYDS